MGNFQNQNSCPRVYLSTKFLRSSDYRRHPEFFNTIFNEIQDDFENNGFRKDSVIEIKYKGQYKNINKTKVKEIWQVKKEEGDFRPLWCYAKDWKYFDPSKFNNYDVLIFDLANHNNINEKANEIPKGYYEFVEYKPKPKVVLDENQKKSVENKNDIVVVEGSAGTGKTVICVEKLKNIWINHKYDNEQLPKVLFLTYSKQLLNNIKQDITNQIQNLKNITLEIQKTGLTHIIKQKPIMKELNIGFNSVKETVYELTSYIDFMNPDNEQGVVFRTIQKNNIPNKEIVDFDIFKNFYKGEYSNLISEALKNDIAKNKVDLEYYFNEIEGVILGLDKDSFVMPKDEYSKLRKEKLQNQLNLTDNGINRFIDVLYRLLDKYQDFLEKEYVEYSDSVEEYKNGDPRNGRKFKYVDRNSIANQIIESNSINYDYVVIDEVQDLTQREISAYIRTCKKTLFAGDTMQMINPTYFSFAMLKDTYNKIKGSSDSIKDEGRLTINYRNSSEICAFANKWIEISDNALGMLGRRRRFDSLETNLFNNQVASNLYLIQDSKLADRIGALIKEKTLNTCLIDSVSAIRDMKGWEEENVILRNLLSANYDKWKGISDKTIKKAQDENSVDRYYFNLFYVAISRAKNNLFIIEEPLPNGDTVTNLSLFKKHNLFDNLNILTNEISDEELLELFVEMDDDDKKVKIEEYLNGGAYARALNLAQTLTSTFEDRMAIVTRCQIYFSYVNKQRLDMACKEFLKNKLYADAANVYDMLGKKETAEFLRHLANNEKINIDLAYKIYCFGEEPEIKKVAQSIIEDTNNYIVKKIESNNKSLKEIKIL